MILKEIALAVAGTFCGFVNILGNDRHGGIIFSASSCFAATAKALAKIRTHALKDTKPIAIASFGE
jgi:hypothetical protein